MLIKAVKHRLRLRGGSQSQLILAADGHEYAVKFQGNPQCTRVLANEYLCGCLARMIGLSVPEIVIILVDSEVIHEYNIKFQLAGAEIAPASGLQLGSRLFCDEEVHDWLPPERMLKIKNIREFAGILAFDKWTGNADGRQAVFHNGKPRKIHSRVRRFRVLLQRRRVEFPGLST